MNINEIMIESAKIKELTHGDWMTMKWKKKPMKKISNPKEKNHGTTSRSINNKFDLRVTNSRDSSNKVKNGYKAAPVSINSGLNGGPKEDQSQSQKKNASWAKKHRRKEHVPKPLPSTHISPNEGSKGKFVVANGPKNTGQAPITNKTSPFHVGRNAKSVMEIRHVSGNHFTLTMHDTKTHVHDIGTSTSVNVCNPQVTLPRVEMALVLAWIV